MQRRRVFIHTGFRGGSLKLETASNIRAFFAPTELEGFYHAQLVPRTTSGNPMTKWGFQRKLYVVRCRLLDLVVASRECRTLYKLKRFIVRVRFPGRE